jgi:hypothetical protein
MSYFNSNKSELKGNKCIGFEFMGTTGGIFTHRLWTMWALQGILAPKCGYERNCATAAATGNSKPSGAAASAVVGGMAGLLMVAAIGSVLSLYIGLFVPGPRGLTASAEFVR